VTARNQIGATEIGEPTALASQLGPAFAFVPSQEPFVWIFLNNAFLSIVDKGGNGATLLVRARRAGDIERVFPKAVVLKTPRNDYRYRAQIDREEVAQAIAAAVRGIDYGNFKATVKEHDRHEAYLDVWGAMHDFQHNL